MLQFLKRAFRLTSGRRPSTLRHTPRAQGAKPCLEALESRWVPAGSITKTGSIISITGADGLKDTATVGRNTMGTSNVHDDKIVATLSNSTGTISRTYDLYKWNGSSWVTNSTGVNFKGLGGNDSFTCSTVVLKVTADGGSGNDTLKGGGGNDRLDGGFSGNDKLYGNGGNDTLVGYSGDDLLYGGDGDDYLDGDAGDDDVHVGRDTLYGENGNDTLVAGYADDALDGGAGDDALYAGSGNDNLFGGDGNDYLFGDYGNDYLDGWTGNDTLDGWYGDDVLLGYDGDDVLLGYDGEDQLYGEVGNDQLYGEDGDDYLDGGCDGFTDALSGGAGIDTVVLDPWDEAEAHYPEEEDIIIWCS